MGNRPRRGPKKGQIDMMRLRIGLIIPEKLEWELRKQSGFEERNGTPPARNVPVAEVTQASYEEPTISRPEYSDVDSFLETFADQGAGLTPQYLPWLREMAVPEIAASSGAAVTTSDDNLIWPSQVSTVLEDQLDRGVASTIVGLKDADVSNWIRSDLYVVNLVPRYFMIRRRSSTLAI
ncbi:hypothetical protein F5Y19DRAFT_482271 [Xylariaceae sp. FL1651]|nr:hypothetical protein F5Y19DRAFT_482271 [Xylariaceae sp. FL1651]